MTTFTRILIRAPVAALALLAAVPAARAAADPIAACRAAHGADPAAHIACLEDALRSQMPAKPAVAPAASAATAAAVVPPGAAPPAQPTGLGAEQAKARQKPLDAAPERAEVRIVTSGYNADGLGTFRMADGQVWRETTPAPKRHKLKPNQEYAARIESSKLGGYRLYVEGKTWMYKVERLK